VKKKKTFTVLKFLKGNHAGKYTYVPDNHLYTHLKKLFKPVKCGASAREAQEICIKYNKTNKIPKLKLISDTQHSPYFIDK